MTTIFEPTTIKNMELKNRLVRSATWEGMCTAEGRPTPQLADFYTTLASGGVGLIISGYTFVRPDGKQLPGKMGIHTGGFAKEMQELTGAVHNAGGKICLQLVHAGGQTDSKQAGRQPLAPSALKVAQFPELPAAMSKEDIDEIIQAFGEGARRAKTWGFDAVQIHGAHGYLISQFLSPLTNQRQDQYGGPLTNRSRFLLEVYQAIRREVGSDYPVLVKLNGSDFLEGGFSTEDAVLTAQILHEQGIDAIEVSGGTPASGNQTPVRPQTDTPYEEGYNLAQARRIKAAVRCPVMVVGGIRSHEMATAIIEEGLDYISLARPLIREPALPRRWKMGDTAPAKCISCNGCFKPGLQGKGIQCIMEQQKK